jgi:hypothetical protein
MKILAIIVIVFAIICFGILLYAPFILSGRISEQEEKENNDGL